MSSHAVPDFADAPIAHDWTLAFQHPLTREAWAYWLRLAGARPMPAAAELGVREMKHFIRHVALLDILRLPEGMDFKVRLAGEDVRRVVGNVSGKRFSEFLPPTQLERWRTGARAVCEKQAPLRSAGGVTILGQKWLDFESLIAPLGAGSEIDVLFAVFVTWSRSAGDRAG